MEEREALEGEKFEVVMDKEVERPAEDPRAPVDTDADGENDPKEGDALRKLSAMN